MFKRTKRLIPGRKVGKSEYMSLSTMITLIPIGVGLVTGFFYVKESISNKNGWDYLMWNEYDTD